MRLHELSRLPKRAFYKLEKKITLNLEYYNENTHETRNIFKPKYKYHS